MIAPDEGVRAAYIDRVLSHQRLDRVPAGHVLVAMPVEAGLDPRGATTVITATPRELEARHLLLTLMKLARPNGRELWDTIEAGGVTTDALLVVLATTHPAEVTLRWLPRGGALEA